MSEVFNPKVSVIIPVYNGSAYLRESIESALAQTYKNLEVIVVNDGSSDDGETEQIALSYADKIIYYAKPNGGVSSALNYGIEHMSGEYFSWLSHDDKYAPAKVEDAVKILSALGAEERRSTIAFTGGYYIDSDSKRKNDFPVNFEKERLYGGNEVVLIMLKNNILNGCCMLIPKKAFEECGGFDETLRYNQDAMMWYTIFTRGYSLISDNNANVMYRLHRNQASKLRRDLFLHDTVKSSEILIPMFAAKSSRECNMLFYYAKRVAIRNCREVVGACIEYGRKNKIITKMQETELKLIYIFGVIRNFIREFRNRLLK